MEETTRRGDHTEGTPYERDTIQRGYTSEGDIYMEETYTRKERIHGKDIHLERPYTWRRHNDLEHKYVPEK